MLSAPKQYNHYFFLLDSTRITKKARNISVSAVEMKCAPPKMGMARVSFFIYLSVGRDGNFNGTVKKMK